MKSCGFPVTLCLPSLPGSSSRRAGRRLRVNSACMLELGAGCRSQADLRREGTFYLRHQSAGALAGMLAACHGRCTAHSCALRLKGQLFWLPKDRACAWAGGHTQVRAAPDQHKDGVLEVQQGGVPWGNPHVAAARRVGPLEELLELCGIGRPLRRVDAARVVFPGILRAQTGGINSRMLGCCGVRQGAGKDTSRRGLSSKA